MNYLEAKTEMQNTPRGVPFRWYALEALLILLVASVLVQYA